MDDIVYGLNSRSREERCRFLERAGEMIKNGGLTRTATEEMNNHVHTSYSFSPYTPSAAAFAAWKSGLKAVGSMDHDSIGAAAETARACRTLGIASTSGFEIRVSFKGTPFEGRKINNPDSEDIVYIAVHGVPSNRIAETGDFLRRINNERNKRNIKETDRLNSIITAYDIEKIDFKKDIYDESMAAEGGSITERHILHALTKKIIMKTGMGPECTRFLTEKLGINPSPAVLVMLDDKENPHYEYDLLGMLKSLFLPDFFIQPDERECIPVREAVEFADGINAIPAYAYLGDVTASITGDKKPEKFEDDFIDELIPELKKIGFKAVTYMPPRNSREQLKRMRRLCGENELMEISGVDINSSRQSFNCPVLLEPEFRHLTIAAWALIAHENLAARDPRFALFHPDNPLNHKSFSEKIGIYGEIGMGTDPAFPENAADPLGYTGGHG